LWTTLRVARQPRPRLQQQKFKFITNLFVNVYSKTAQICAVNNNSKETESPAISQTQAAEMLNVSRRTVQQAMHVRDNGVPELKKAVEQGEIPVSAASEVAKLPEEEQKNVVSQGKKAIMAKAKEIRKAKKIKEIEIRPEVEPLPDWSKCNG
jgi:hypothetical protein